MLLPAREAADRLGVKIDTLYAYVSRGLLRSKEVSGSRERHYDADQIEQFRAGRGATRARPPAEDLIPVIGSAICLIENHRLYYRGKDAVALAETATLEDAAALLWEEDAPRLATFSPQVPPVSALGERVGVRGSISSGIARSGLPSSPVPITPRSTCRAPAWRAPGARSSPNSRPASRESRPRRNPFTNGWPRPGSWMPAAPT